MSVNPIQATPARQYKGMRYVPIFDGDWDNTKDYDPLVVVSYQGNSYTSRTFVPHGISITNEKYWALTGNYNAQVEAYRLEVLALTEKVGKQISFYDTVADMINDLEIEANSVIFTKGYTTVNDGGGAIYLISENVASTDFYVTLNNGLYAILQHNGTINTKCLNTTDFDYIYNRLASGFTVIFNGETMSAKYDENRVINNINDVTLIGNGTTINVITPFTTTGSAVINFVGCDNINIEGFVIDGKCSNNEAGAVDTQQCHAIRLRNVKHYSINNCVLHDFQGDGIEIGSFDPTVIPSDGIISENIIYNVHRNGISILDCNSVEICNNVIHDITNWVDNPVLQPLAWIDLEPYFTGQTFKHVKVHDNTAYECGVCSLYNETNDTTNYVFNNNNTTGYKIHERTAETSGRANMTFINDVITRFMLILGDHLNIKGNLIYDNFVTYSDLQYTPLLLNSSDSYIDLDARFERCLDDKVSGIFVKSTIENNSDVHVRCNCPVGRTYNFTNIASKIETLLTDMPTYNVIVNTAFRSLWNLSNSVQTTFSLADYYGPLPFKIANMSPAHTALSITQNSNVTYYGNAISGSDPITLQYGEAIEVRCVDNTHCIINKTGNY